MDAPLNIIAVVVAFHPDIDALRDNLARLGPQVAQVWVIDNSEAPDCRRAIANMASTQVAVESSGVNRGIAAALNTGVRNALQAGADAVLLLDQDSAPAPDMVARLCHDLLRASTDGSPVAAIGPVQVDARTGARAPFVRFGFPLNHKQHAAAGEVVRCDFLITSGCLVPRAAFERVGAFDEALFIDNVDMEWSHRARALGWTLLGSGSASMQHRLGDRLARRPGGFAAVHAPTRLYYMMRNRVHLYRRPGTPGVWVAQDVPRLVLKLVGFSLFVAPRRANARAMLAGIVDGLAGRLGVRRSSV